MGYEPGKTQISRRKFLGYAIGGIGGIIGAVVAWPLVGYFLSPAWRKSTPSLIPVARTSDIPIGEPTFVTYEEGIRDGWYVSTLGKGAWVVNKGGTEFIVFDDLQYSTTV